MNEHGCTFNAALQELLICVEAERIRHHPVGISDHAVGGDNGVALDAAHNAAILEDSKVTQQRDYADDDHNGTYDLFGTAINRQQIDEVEDENDNDESDQNADKDRHETPRDEMIRPQLCAS